MDTYSSCIHSSELFADCIRADPLNIANPSFIRSQIGLLGCMIAGCLTMYTDSIEEDKELEMYKQDQRDDKDIVGEPAQLLVNTDA